MISKLHTYKALKNPLWALEKAYLLGRSSLCMKSDDMLLAGFPKTGTTWVRFFIYSLLKQKVNELGGTIDDMNDYIPEYGHKSLFSPWVFEECARIIKTHRHCLSSFENKKTALLIRDPRDISISYYHYVTGMKGKSEFKGTLKDVIRNPAMGLEAFFIHYNSWINNAGVVIKYEDLKSDPVSNFTKLSKFYGITSDIQRIEKAVFESDFLSMKRAQKKSQRLKSEFKEGHEFVRSGKKSQWIDVFDDDDISYFNDLKKKYNIYVYE